MALTDFQKQRLLSRGYTAEQADALSVGQTVSDNPNFFLTPVTSDLLSMSSAPINYVKPESLPIYPVDKLDVTVPQLAPTEPERQATDIERQLQEVQRQLIGESTYRAEQEKVQGIPGAIKTQTDLSSRLKALQNEALAIPLQMEREFTGRASIGEIGAKSRAVLRENAIQALGVSSLLEASRGNIVTAQALADRAVDQQFGSLKEKQRALIANLDLIIKSPAYSLADKNRAEQRKAIEEAKSRELGKRELEKKEIMNTANLAIKYGLTDSSLIKQISESNTSVEAFQKAAPYLQDPKAKLELEQTRLENILKQKQTEKVQREISDSEKNTPKEAAKDEAKRIAALETLPVAQDKVNLISGLINHAGLASSVGPVKFLRRDITAGFTGQKADFIAGVNLLIQKETLDTLINLKKQGGTLGALSEGEARMLREAASKIGSWIEKDSNTGEVLGFKVTEKLFKKELERIQELAQRALTKAQGTVLESEDESILNDVFSTPNTEGVTNFNPAGFY